MPVVNANLPQTNQPQFDITLPAELKPYEKNYNGCPADALKKQAKELLVTFGKSQVGSLLLEPTIVPFLIEHLYREFKERNESSKLFKFKHLLYAGMLLRYIRLDLEQKNFSILYQHHVYKLYLVLGAKVVLADMLKHDPLSRFYADSFSIALDNLKQLHRDWKVYSCSSIENSNSGLIANLAIEHCIRLHELATAIPRCRKMVPAAELPRLGILLIEHPFVADLKNLVPEYYDIIISKYIAGILTLAAWRNPAIHNNEYIGSIDITIQRLFKQHPVLVATRCVYLLVQNQINRYVHIVDQSSFRLNLLPLILQFLRTPRYLNEKYALLRNMAESLSVHEVKAFARELAADLNTANADAYELKVLKYIYDLRLALRDINHLNNQIQKLFFNQDKKVYCSYMVPQICNDLWHDQSPDSGLDPYVQQRLACLEYNAPHAIKSTEELNRIKVFLQSGSTSLATQKIDPTLQKLAVQSANCAQALTSTLRNLLTALILQTDETIKLRFSAIIIDDNLLFDRDCYAIIAELHASINYSGAGNWVYHDPSLPQGYLRFIGNDLNQIAKHIFESLLENTALEIKKENLIANRIFVQPLTLSFKPNHYNRRSATPMAEDPAQVYIPVLQRSYTAPPGKLRNLM